MSTKMLAILTYPPDHDGQLDIHIDQKPMHSRADKLEITLTIAQQPGESVKATLRRLGCDLTSQPIFFL